jgi:tetratricopeptide (TPR) repeat protein
MNRKIILFIFLFFPLLPFSQVGLIQLANEYFADGQYFKAKSIYEEIAKDPKKSEIIYPNYIVCLYHLNELKDAEKIIKRMIKLYPEYVLYKIDLIECLEKQGKKDEAKKYEERVVNEIIRNSSSISLAASYLLSKGNDHVAEKIYLKSRKFYSNENLYAYELAEIYKNRGEKQKFFHEILKLIDSEDFEKIRNQLQNLLESEKDYQILETALIDRVQLNPENKSYVELLIWLYIQQKNFTAAFTQAKALDKRFKLQGYKVFELLQIAYENESYNDVIKIYTYLNHEYPKSPIATQSKFLAIKSREKLIFDNYPINKQDIGALLNDYKSLLKENYPSQGYEIQRNIASLYAFYLDQKDSAIALLSDIIKSNVQHESQMAKLLLADVYLLYGEPWESALLCMQVEKEKKDDLLGYEAKFKSAKLFFYNNEFELALEQLNILKQATSREIANDAMQLSLVISSSLNEDSNTELLAEYAKLYLYMYLKKYEKAFEIFQKIEKELDRNNTLKQECMWIKYRICYLVKNYDEAKECLEVIERNFTEYYLYADDALFELGKLYERVYNNRNKALEYYQKLINQYPGSVYVVEARKKIRILRGDKIF